MPPPSKTPAKAEVSRDHPIGRELSNQNTEVIARRAIRTPQGHKPCAINVHDQIFHRPRTHPPKSWFPAGNRPTGISPPAPTGAASIPIGHPRVVPQRWQNVVQQWIVVVGRGPAIGVLIKGGRRLYAAFHFIPTGHGSQVIRGIHQHRVQPRRGHSGDAVHGHHFPFKRVRRSRLLGMRRPCPSGGRTGKKWQFCLMGCLQSERVRPCGLPQTNRHNR